VAARDQPRRNVSRGRATARAMAQAKAHRRPSPPIAPKAVHRAVRASQEAHAYAVLRGEEARPAHGTREGKQLARMASLASHGKADPAFEAAFKEYWYHKEGGEGPSEADEDYDYEADEDEDEE
jgi:hypothetical protein